MEASTLIRLQPIPEQIGDVLYYAAQIEVTFGVEPEVEPMHREKYRKGQGGKLAETNAPLIHQLSQVILQAMDVYLFVIPDLALLFLRQGFDVIIVRNIFSEPNRGERLSAGFIPGINCLGEQDFSGSTLKPPMNKEKVSL